MDGVLEAEAIDREQWRLRCEPGRQARQNIARASATGQWELFELRTEEQRLEDVFAELTGAPPLAWQEPAR